SGVVTIVKRRDELREALTARCPHTFRCPAASRSYDNLKGSQSWLTTGDSSAAPGQQFQPNSPGPLRCHACHHLQNQGARPSEIINGFRLNMRLSVTIVR